jgi:hypothetical protein
LLSLQAQVVGLEFFNHGTPHYIVLRWIVWLKDANSMQTDASHHGMSYYGGKKKTCFCFLLTLTKFQIQLWRLRQVGLTLPLKAQVVGLEVFNLLSRRNPNPKLGHL